MDRRVLPAHTVRTRLLAGVAGALLACVPVVATAHPLDITFTVLTIQEASLTADTNLTARQVAVALLDTETNFSAGDIAHIEDALRAHHATHLAFDLDGAPCTLQRQELTYPRGDTNALLLDGLRLTATYSCPQAIQLLSIQNTLFLEGFPDQRNIVVFNAEPTAIQYVFSRTERAGMYDVSRDAFQFSAGRRGPHESLLTSISRFIRLGSEHVALGFDHLLFMVGIYLVVRKPRELLRIVTSFTVAHSITLALSTLDVVRLPSRFVETAVAGTIVYVGLENLFRRTFRHRALITFGLGLIHGLGFSSALREIGIPTQYLLPDLLAFNVGVEIGQLAVVLTLAPFLVVAARSPRVDRWVVRLGSLGISAIGLAWFLQRITAGT